MPGYRSVTGVVIALTIAPVGCMADISNVEAEDTAEVQQEIVKTAYRRDGGDRYVYALNPPAGSYVVQLTWKEWGGCHQTQMVMELLPASETTASVCAAVGLEYKVLSGNVNVCATTTTSQPTPVYYLRWGNISAREVNYRVLDRGPAGTYDSSGWLPDTPGNGCTRPN